ncbi:hypothetical protein RN19_22870 [Xanthomonas phaseoli pv. phaseoli]|nr:hypothetical protein RN19_22870 [Xanthomonas phaseoli pv. phaseoli]
MISPLELDFVGSERSSHRWLAVLYFDLWLALGALSCLGSGHVLGAFIGLGYVCITWGRYLVAH